MEKNEKKFAGFRMSGFSMLAVMLLLLVGGVWLLTQAMPVWGGLCLLLFVLCLPGFMMIEPNEARVMLFFGVYKGTLNDNGFWWVSPFYAKKKMTYRARNLDIEPIKVNDKAGNPVMIGLVLVWRVKDTYKAMFEIDSQETSGVRAVPVKGGVVAVQQRETLASRMAAYQNFVSVQSDAALRSLAGEYAYDNNESSDEVTLRSGGEEINDRLEHELNSRLAISGIEVVEARINYLAYAPEIAAVMLRRQQAAAIISAREKIVEGAVTMVQMALDRLAAEKVVDLDEDKKAAMVSNLLVVLCADEQAQPVVNTGTLHQ